MSSGRTVQVLPPLASVVSQGDSWQVRTVTASAALTAEPTTTAALVLYNGETRTITNTGGIGKAYIIDSVQVVREVVDVTQTDATSVWAMLNAGAVTAPTNDTALTIRSLCGRARAYPGLALKAVAQTVTNDGWFTIGMSPPVPSAVAGSAWNMFDVRLEGKYIVPPGGQFNLQVVQVAGAASQIQIAVAWHEAFLVGMPLL